MDEEYVETRIRLRCTNKKCDMSKGFWTAPKFKENYLEKLDCLLCGAKHAEELKIVSEKGNNLWKIFCTI